MIRLSGAVRMDAMRVNKPKRRLRMCEVGTRLMLVGVERWLIVSRLREDGYIDLINDRGYLSVTASPCHEVIEDD